MKQMKTIRSLIVLLTAICFGLAVIAFFLPHGIGTVCAPSGPWRWQHWC